MEKNFYYINDIIGHEVMKYLDSESLFSIRCIPYLSNILDEIHMNHYPLINIWRDRYELEQYEKENIEYTKYLVDYMKI